MSRLRPCREEQIPSQRYLLALEFLAVESLTTWSLAYRLGGFSRGYAAVIVRVLRRQGFVSRENCKVEMPGQSTWTVKYRITDLGREFLAAQLHPS